MPSVSITIHRSASQIGGNCIEIATGDGQRLLLDAGRPLDTPEGESTPLPGSLDLDRPPLAVLLSHGHQDHMGLLPQLPAEWSVWCGKPTGRLLALLGGILDKPVPQQLGHWESGKEFGIGPFRITPILTDHSAFDAHMLLVQVSGRAILYTGDFRDHGRKGKLVDRTPSGLPHLDALILEGTNLGSGKPVRPESQLEEEFAQCFRSTPGRVFISWSAMNIDRTVSIYRACKRTRRLLAVDLYTAAVLRAVRTKNDTIPQPDWPEIRVVVTSSLAQRFKAMGQDALLQELLASGHAISARNLQLHPHRWAIMTRGSLARSYERKGLVPTPDDVWVWSQWRGYLDTEDGLGQRAYFASCGFQHIHTSGHASETCLARFAEALGPRVVIPVHGENWDSCEHGLKNIVRLRDGQTFHLDG